MAERRLRTHVLAGIVGAVGLALSACTGSPPPATVADVSALDAQHTQPRSSAPAARSGDLGREDLPAPEALGSGWEYRVDPGNPEDGYRGSGEAANAREPLEVLGAITPLGCRPGRLPVPERALEVTYAHGALPAVGLLLRFVDADTAAHFFHAHTEVVRECVGRRIVDLTVLTTQPSLFISQRTEHLGETPTWVEGVGLRGDEVLLVAVADDGADGVLAVEAALR